MASSVYYRFKSQREESRISFDGTGISIFELKKEIILANNLGAATDFDLHLYDSSTEAEYNDDGAMIPRSSSVIAKRLPASRPGRGRAAMYIAGTTADPKNEASGSATASYTNKFPMGSMSKRFDGKDEQPKNSKPMVPTSVEISGIQDEDEAAAMAAMFQAQTENWQETQDRMSHQTRVPFQSRPGAPRRTFPQPEAQPERPLPPSYVCYRCGQKGKQFLIAGHWIQDCPTNNDREFDNKPRIKRTTGIPRSFLKAVERPTDGVVGQGVMITPEGSYVVAQPDSASWQKQVARSKALPTEADIRERPTKDVDPSLVCPMDSRLFREAVKTPCCGTLYCEECVQTYLLDHDFLCSGCGAKITSIDKLIVDKPTRARVHDYIDKAIAESKKELEEAVAAAAAAEKKDEDDTDTKDDVPSEGVDGQQANQNQNFMSMNLLQPPNPTELKAQITQVSIMLGCSGLPAHIRQNAEMTFQQLQMQLQQAQAFYAFAQAQGAAVAAAVQQAANAANMAQMAERRANAFPIQQQAPSDSPYQRLPVNNRRRNLKRDRPSDFLEMTESKAIKYWE